MHRDSIDTSSISFTALYTGHVWTANDLSAPEFQTRMGALYYHALTPFEAIGGKLAGGNIRTSVLQRHYLIDHLLKQSIEQQGVEQVLEIACGLSPRGHRFCSQYPGLRYIEADLPDMASRKARLLEKTDTDLQRHQVKPVNILADDGPLALSAVLDNFDHSRPLTIITEGLVNYFSLDTISNFWTSLREQMDRFPRATYLTDNYPLLLEHPFYRTMKLMRGLLGTISRSRASFHFGSDSEAREHFRSLGFCDVNIHVPEDYFERLPMMPRPGGQSFVRIIEASS